MIRIMIVDDMPIFLEYLKGCIDWKTYGFEICAEAHDGKEALEKIEECYPDVVLTDITMPYINGLELAEIITKDYPDISVILITGNNEFEYARKAVKIGVCDYIVKPFEKEELILSLLKLQDNIGKAIENTTDQSEDDFEELRALIYVGAQGQENKNIFSKSENVTGDTSAGIKEAEEKKKNEGYLLALFRFDTEAYKGNVNTREILMNWESLIAKMLGDKLEIKGEFKIFHDLENNIVTIMRFDELKDLESYKGYEFTDIIQVVKNQLGMGSAIALAKASSLNDMKSAYEKALNFLNEKGYGQLWDLRKNAEVKIYSSIDAIIRLNKDLEALEAEDAKSVINGMWEAIRAGERSEGNNKMSISDMNILTSAISILMTNILNKGLSIEKIYGEGFSTERFMAEAGTPEQMKENVIFLYKKRIEFEKNRQDTKTHDVALCAKEYIENHYTDSSLAIADISEELCVNQTYLRKMFKSEMDMTLSEYITKIRMQEAKKLLTTTDEKLTVIAEDVGYNDVSYFSNVFKKYYGKSPRSMVKGED